jgi:pimeloyl-ACP methyl ester carboxylesterase
MHAMRRALRTIVIAALVVFVLYAALLAAIYFGRNKLLFPGAGIVAQPVDVAAAFPNAEDVKIPVDGTTFAHAWWIPSQSGTARTLLWFHGNGYPLEAETETEAPALYKQNVNLLLVDYRGYGASSPITTTAETTAADARAAFRYLTDEKHIAPSDIWIAGRSIGAAVAVRLAAETPNAAGLILITPTSNTADVEPYRRWIKPLKWFGLAKPFDSLARMPQIHMPVTIVAGSLDTLAPPWMARALLKAANPPKTIRMIERAGHNDIFDEDNEHLLSWEVSQAMSPPVYHAKPGTKPTPAAQVVRNYLALVEKGELLNPDGWKRASAFFISAKPYPETGRIQLIDSVVEVDEYALNRTAAMVGS